MLTGKNLVLVKGQEPKEYDRVYLEFGPQDKVESYSKTQDGKDVLIGGKKWEGTRPASERTEHTNSEELVEAAVAYFSERYPTHKDDAGKDVPNDPWLILLEAASYGADLWVRNEIQGKIRPGKPKDKGKALDAMVKNLLAAGMAKSESEARKMLEGMLAAQQTEEITA